MHLMTPEDFAPWVGKAVRVDTVPEPVEVTLVSVQRHAWSNNPFREPFSLFFEAPADVYLLDRAYRFDCGRGGPYTILIAQLMPSEGRRVYQAVFG